MRCQVNDGVEYGYSELGWWFWWIGMEIEDTGPSPSPPLTGPAALSLEAPAVMRWSECEASAGTRSLPVTGGRRWRGGAQWGAAILQGASVPNRPNTGLASLRSLPLGMPKIAPHAARRSLEIGPAARCRPLKTLAAASSVSRLQRQSPNRHRHHHRSLSQPSASMPASPKPSC